ncbi:MAG: response regulator [Treponema sp.]|nr:response regulator [Treponema sp.]
MGKELVRNFDLTTLLRQGDLDIRKIAEKDLSLSIAGYFSLLTRFLADAPRALDALARIASLDAQKDDCQTVENIKTLLEDMSCKKFTLILSDIISAIKSNKADFAASCTKSILDDLKAIYDRIHSAEITEDRSDLLASDDSPHASGTIPPFSAQTLKKMLDKLDREEEKRKMRILVVDDSSVILQTVSSILDDKYKVYGIANPMMIEKFLQQIVPELFLLDYEMPGRSGFELIPIIRSFQEHKDTPVIILTAMGTIEHISASHSLGACDFIVKPVQEDILRKKIAKHIVRKKLF